MAHLKILIVEDLHVNAQYLKYLLKDIGKEVFYAENGKEAIDIVDSNPEIDLVLMDINMPIMDGYNASRIIKEKYPSLCIIAQTAYISDTDLSKKSNENFDEILIKPIFREKLISCICNHFPKLVF
jgi:CheY-like chemotaxis protein